MNSSGVDQLPHHLPLCAERRDERTQHDQARVDEQLGDFADAPDIFHAVGVGEAEIAVQAVANVVAVEHVGMSAARVKLPLHDAGDGALAGA